MPVILSASQSSATSDANGLANFLATIGLFTAPLVVEIQVSPGTAAALQDVIEIFQQSPGLDIPAITRSLGYRRLDDPPDDGSDGLTPDRAPRTHAPTTAETLNGRIVQRPPLTAADADAASRRSI
jgi:hypothetical protein